MTLAFCTHTWKRHKSRLEKSSCRFRRAVGLSAADRRRVGSALTTAEPGDTWLGGRIPGGWHSGQPESRALQPRTLERARVAPAGTLMSPERAVSGTRCRSGRENAASTEPRLWEDRRNPMPAQKPDLRALRSPTRLAATAPCSSPAWRIVHE